MTTTTTTTRGYCAACFTANAGRGAVVELADAVTVRYRLSRVPHFIAWTYCPKHLAGLLELLENIARTGAVGSLPVVELELLVAGTRLELAAGHLDGYADRRAEAVAAVAAVDPHRSRPARRAALVQARTFDELDDLAAALLAPPAVDPAVAAELRTEARVRIYARSAAVVVTIADTGRPLAPPPAGAWPFTVDLEAAR